MAFTDRLGDRVARLALTGLLVGALGLSLAACGGTASESAPEPTATTAPDTSSGGTDGSGSTGTDGSGAASTEVKPLTATLKEWVVEVDNELEAGTYAIDVTNAGTFPHDLVIQDASGNEVGRTPTFKQDAGVQTLEVGLKPGTYKFLCDIPGHPQQGMTTDVTVK